MRRLKNLISALYQKLDIDQVRLTPPTASNPLVTLSRPQERQFKHPQSAICLENGHESKAVTPEPTQPPTTFHISPPIPPRGSHHFEEMSFNLPGLGLEDSPTPSHSVLHHPSAAQNVPTATTTLTVQKQNEYRLEVPVTTTLVLKLLTGTAEIFGTELVIGNSYTISGQKLAIFSWHGCSLEVTGPEDFPGGYVAEETPMNEYINVHFALERMRGELAVPGHFQSGRASPVGPRVLILGPQDSGKTSLAKLLTAYAIRSARSPVVVNLDPQEGMLSVPGTLSAAVFKSLLDVEEGWGCTPMSGPAGVIPVKLPLVYYYGSDRVDEQQRNGQRSAQLYRNLAARLALAVSGRLQQDPEAGESGVIIDTPAFLAAGTNTNLLAHVVSEFSVNCIVCLGSERLWSDVVKRFDGTPVASSSSSTTNTSTATNEADKIQVIRLPKSGGTVDRDPTFLHATRTQQVRRYFYGDDRLQSQGGGIKLSPRVLTADSDSLTVHQLVDFQSSPHHHNHQPSSDVDEDDSEFLPGDSEPNYYSSLPQPLSSSSSSTIPVPSTQLFTRLAPTLSPSIASHLLAILNCGPEPTQQDLAESSVMGFLLVQSVESSGAGSTRLRLLSPVAGRVPERAVVLGDTRMAGYVDLLR